MPAKDKLDPIYSPDYYRMEKLLRSSLFQAELQKLRESWEAWGVPIPENGFESVKDYHEWRERLLKVYKKQDESKEVADAMKQVDDDPAFNPTEKIWRRYEARDKLLPPLPWSFIYQILAASDLDPKNQKYQDFLTLHILFQHEYFSEAFFGIVWKRNEKIDQMELFLKLEPHTKIEHITAAWKNRIDPEVKRLPGYIGKNKAWQRFDDDLAIYTAYKKIQLEVLGEGKRSTKEAIDTLTWNYLREKHPKKFRKLTLSQIRKARSKIVKL